MKVCLQVFLLVISLFLVMSCGGSGDTAPETLPEESLGPVEPVTPIVPPVEPEDPTPPEDPLPPQVSPVISSTFPANGAALIAKQQAIVISFESPLDPDSIANAFEIDSPYEGVLTYSAANNAIIFTPSNEFAAASEITVTLNTSLMSETKAALDAPLAFSFFTRGVASQISDITSAKVAILDLSDNNGGSTSDLAGLSHALDIAGVSHTVVASIEDIPDYNALFLTSYISPSTLSNSDIAVLESYVQDGGILIARNVSEPALYSLFGVQSGLSDRFRKEIIWNQQSTDTALRYTDDLIQSSLSLGSDSDEPQLQTYGYIPSSGATLASFEDGSSAVISHKVALGETILLGVSFSDLTLRNQRNLDFNAQRGSINDIETTTDQFILFLRAILESRLSPFIYKHSSPKNSVSTLMITHDIDSQSGADMLFGFAALENENDIKATYNVTTHYIDDAIDGDYYSMNIDIYKALLADGHEIASHSVGHFRDFDKHDIIPVGAPGNTKDNYLPFNDGTITTNATVYGELEVSKKLLETDVGATISSFRSGHLLWNKHQGNVLEALSYKYDSSFSARDSLTNFPFRMSYDKTFSAELSSVFVFPIAISDNISGNDTPENVAKRWFEALEVNRANYAPTVLLIHPNRDYKLTELEFFLGMVPANTVTRTVVQFGDFWSARDRVNMSFKTAGNSLSVEFDNTFEQLHEDFSVVVDGAAGLYNVDVVDANGVKLYYDAHMLDSNKIVLHSFRLE